MFGFEFSDQVPPNGLVIYCGTIVTDEGKEKKVTILSCDAKIGVVILQRFCQNSQPCASIIACLFVAVYISHFLWFSGEH